MIRAGDPRLWHPEYDTAVADRVTLHDRVQLAVYARQLGLRARWLSWRLTRTKINER